MPKREAQTIEYKSSWHDDYFEWISGYANGKGGTLYIGVNDDGYVVGVEDTRFLLDQLPNKINSSLGITVSIDHGTVSGLGENIKYGNSIPNDIAMKPVNLYARKILTEQVLSDIDTDPVNTKNVTPAVQKLFDAAPGFVKHLRQSVDNRKKIREDLQRLNNENPVHQNPDGSLEYVWITVKEYSHGVPYHGRYYTRSGGTTHEMIGAELANFLYDKVGMKWDAVPVRDVVIEHSALEFLREHAVEKNRLTAKAVAVSDETLVRNLQVLTKDGEYTRAAAMLFGNPEDVAFGSYIRIGFFENGRLKYQDEIHGPLISQAHRATEMIFNKYLKALVDIEGMQRTETYMTTEELLREVILNAVAHKYYPSNLPIQIKVSDDHITVMNEGFWPFDNLAVEDVYNGEHSSYPANPTIDNGLFFAGAMDTWGQGFLLIKDECEKTDAPLPEIKATEKYVTVTIHGCRKYMELLNNSTTANSTTSGGEGGGVSGGDDKQLIVIEFCAEAHSKPEIQEYLGIKSERYVREKLINPLLKDGRLRRTEKKLNSKNQKYISTKTEMERAQAILDNNPVLEYSPGDLRREGRTVEEYLEKYGVAERKRYLEYYEDEV